MTYSHRSVTLGTVNSHSVLCTYRGTKRNRTSGVHIITLPDNGTLPWALQRSSCQHKQLLSTLSKVGASTNRQVMMQVLVAVAIMLTFHQFAHC